MLILRMAAFLAVALLPSAALAQSDTSIVQRQDGTVQLVVASRGTATSQADRATLTIGIRSQAPLVAEAKAKLAAETDKVMRELGALGVAKADITTQESASRLGFVGNDAAEIMAAAGGDGEATKRPRYANTTLSVVVRNLAVLPRIRTLLENREGVTLGAPSYELSDSRAARRVAIADAIAKAQSDAAAYAQALRMRLGPIISVRDQAAGPSVMAEFAEFMDRFASEFRSPTPTVTTAVSVAVEFSLARP